MSQVEIVFHLRVQPLLRVSNYFYSIFSVEACFQNVVLFEKWNSGINRKVFLHSSVIDFFITINAWKLMRQKHITKWDKLSQRNITKSVGDILSTAGIKDVPTKGKTTKWSYERFSVTERVGNTAANHTSEEQPKRCNAAILKEFFHIFTEKVRRYEVFYNLESI